MMNQQSSSSLSNSPATADRPLMRPPSTGQFQQQQQQQQSRSSVNAQEAAARLRARIREPENAKHRVPLGNGSFGAVYQALDVETGALIALKKMPIDTQRIKKEQIERIVNEIQIMKAMKHKNIIEYVGAGRMEEGTSLWIAMECAVGGSLSQVIDRYGTLPESLVRKYVRDCVEGLAYLHSQRVAHRDIKCENLLLCNTNDVASDGKSNVCGVVKLADFGSAKKIAGEEGMSSTMVGTVLFMAPEVALLQVAAGNKLNNNNNSNNTGLMSNPTGNNNNNLQTQLSGTNNNNNNNNGVVAGVMNNNNLFFANLGDIDTKYDIFKADIWTLGITVIQMLEGKPPFSQLSWLIHVSNPESQILKLPENISPECLDFLEKCLRRNPKERPSAADLLNHPFMDLSASVSTIAMSNTNNGTNNSLFSPVVGPSGNSNSAQQRPNSSSLASGLTLDALKQHNQIIKQRKSVGSGGAAIGTGGGTTTTTGGGGGEGRPNVAAALANLNAQRQQ